MITNGADSEAFLIEYFTGLASKIKEVSHTDEAKAFYCMADPTNLVEFDSGVRSMSQDNCLILELGSGSYGEYDAQNDTVRIGLHALSKSDSEVYDDIRSARSIAKIILKKAVAQIRLDCKGQFERPDNTVGPLRAQCVTFDTKVKYSNMSGIDGNWYGKSFYFEFRVPMNLVWNANDYNS